MAKGYPKIRLPPKKGTSWCVVMQRQGGSHTMKCFTSYKKALGFYRAHPRAYGIQKYKGGVTAGLLQPDMPSKIKRNGKIYKRGYVGPHTKAMAQRLARSFRKNFRSVLVLRFKRGYQVYVWGFKG